MKLEANKAVKFSYDLIRGSVKKRNKSVRKISDRIYNGILENTENGEVYLNDIRNTIWSILPEKKNIRINKIKKDDPRKAYEEIVSDYKNNYIGYEIGIPVQRSKMKIETLPILMHEITHVLDELHNPKFTKRMYDIDCAAEKMSDSAYKSKSERGMKLYKKDIYNVEFFENDEDKKKIIEGLSKKVKKYLSGKTVDEKIDYIQNVRYYLLSELNAYTADNMYAHRMKDSGYKIDMTDYDGRIEKLMLKEKIDMIKKIGIDVVNKARKRLRAKNGLNFE